MSDFVLKLGANLTGFERGLEQAKTRAGDFKKTIASIAIPAGFLSWLKSSIDHFDRLAALAVRLNSTLGATQKVSFLADMNDTDVETLAQGMTMFAKSLDEAAAGGDKAAEKFAKFGISAADFAGLEIDEQVYRLADAYLEARKSGSGMQSVLELMGKRAAELIPLLAKGGEELRRMSEQAVILSPEEVERIKYVDDALARWTGWLKTAGGAVVSFLTPTSYETEQRLRDSAHHQEKFAEASKHAAAELARQAEMARKLDEAMKAASAAAQKLWDSQRKFDDATRNPQEKALDATKRWIAAQSDALDARAKAVMNPTQDNLNAEIEANARLLDAKRELISAEKELAEENQKRATAVAEAAKKTYEEVKKGGEKTISELRKAIERDMVITDPVRAIGGSLGGVNYQAGKDVAGEALAGIRAIENNLALSKQILQEILEKDEFIE